MLPTFKIHLKLNVIEQMNVETIPDQVISSVLLTTFQFGAHFTYLCNPYYM